MARPLLGFCALALILAGLLAACGSDTPQAPPAADQPAAAAPVAAAVPTPTDEPVATSAARQTATPTAMSMQQPTATPEPTATPTPTPMATSQPTATPAPQPSPTATPSPTAAPREQPTSTSEPTATPAPTPMPTSQPTAISAPQPTPTPPPSPTAAPVPNQQISEQRAALVALYNSTDGPNWTNNANWLTDEPLGTWHGVTVDRSGRVVRLVLGDQHAGNNLRGQIPVELGRLTQLEALHLPNNQLSGEIPAELGNLANLKRLWLSGNKLTGEIPLELGRLISLERIWLSGNRLTGQIPPELGSLTTLVVLQIHHNQLSGNIPAELGNLTGLRVFTLHNNELAGAIPAELDNLINLKELRLDNNQLSGCVPGNLREHLTADPGIPFCCRTIFLESIVEQVTSPSYVKWEISNGVSEEDRRNAMHSAGLIHDYAVSIGLPEIESDLTIYIHDDMDALAAIYAELSGNSVRKAREFWENSGGVAAEGWAIINRSPQRVQSGLSRDLRLTVAHELFHIYQAELADLPIGAASDAVPKAGPRWLSEGIADYFTYRALNAGGVLDYECARESVDPWGFVKQGEYVDIPLQEMETWAGLSGARGNAYSYSLLAAELLASFASEEALLRFYQYLEPGTTWQDAFQEAFRMPVEEFYIFFEEHRAAGFPETSTYVSGHPNFIFGPYVGEDWPRIILDDLDIIRQWFSDSTGIDVDGTLPEGYTIFVFGDHLGTEDPRVKARRLDAYVAFREDLTPADRQFLKDEPVGLGWGLGYPDHILNCTCRLPRTRLSIAHEMTHSLQGNLSGGWRRETPIWLDEGMAEHLSRVLAAERGMEKCNPNRCNGADSFNGYLISALDNPLLETQETRDGLAGLKYPYASGMVASAILAELAGMPSLMEFYALIGEGHDWRNAFREAFGMTASEFYELYERSKENGFPELPPEVRDLP